MYLNAQGTDGIVTHMCRQCGVQEPFKPVNLDDALILETNFRSGSSASGPASGITINANTLQDPANPSFNTLACPNTTCPSQTDESKRDVMYIKTDTINMKFRYICKVCKSEWAS
jgi:hypothetical protein